MLGNRNCRLYFRFPVTDDRGTPNCGTHCDRNWFYVGLFHNRIVGRWAGRRLNSRVGLEAVDRTDYGGGNVSGRCCGDVPEEMVENCLLLLGVPNLLQGVAEDGKGADYVSWD